MELGIEAARWVVSKALDSASGGVLEAWAASSELGNNIRELRLELLYAHGMLNNARGRDRAQEIKNPALTELLQELRDLGYRADDVMDELEYFRIQDELDGTYHAADEHDGGCLYNHALNARHTARDVVKKLVGFSKSSGSDGSHDKGPSEEDTRRVSCGALPACLRPTSPASDDDDPEEEDATQSRAVLCGAAWTCGMAFSTTSTPANQNASPSSHEEVLQGGCMRRLSSCIRNTISTPGKHFTCYSAPPVQNDSNSNTASSGRGFLHFDRPNKAKLKFDRVEMSRKMKEIVEQLKPVCAKVSTILNLELLDSNRNIAQAIAESLDAKKHGHASFLTNSNKTRPVTTSEPIERKLYGRDGTKSNIIREITEEQYCDKDLTVLPIVGPGGIGKTTLAQYIYQEVCDHFEVKLWVCVSLDFNVYRLRQELARTLTKGNKGDPEKQIEEGLKSKRFLLVLDDMWSCSEDEWTRFMVLFNKGPKRGSAILVTTRFPALAKMVRTTNHSISLEGLDSESFEELFYAYVFDESQSRNDYSELMKVGYKIMQKLKGSPLAAKTVGRLLRNHLDWNHWTRVLESKEWESRNDDHHDIMPALKLSFDYLPFHLQQCFTYCALFPEDYRFRSEELIRFWIGLDILHSYGHNKRIEDIGENYLTELVQNGFFKTEKKGGVTRYVIHDLLHELALKVSSHECLSINSSNVRSTQIPPSIRHMSVNIDDSSFKDKVSFDVCKEDLTVLNKRLRVENLHSLMLFGKHQAGFVKTLCGLFRKAKALRVIFLSTENCSIEDLLPNYLNLVHLRYLRIRGVFESRLCNNISKYYHLRVLDLSESFYRAGLDLPRDMNLMKLRHFLVGCHTEMHSKISNVGRLVSLQALERFVVKKESQGFELKQIGHLVELSGSLHICNLEKLKSREEAEEAKLMHKKHLHKLILNWDIKRSSKDPACEEKVLEGLKPNSNLSKIYIIGHGGTMCPSWLGVNLCIENLKSLCLNNVGWKTFPPIGKLWLHNAELPSKIPNRNFHNLRSIELVKLEGVNKWVVDTNSQFYSCLVELKIEGCNELMELSFSNSACHQQEQNIWFPKLQVLNIKDCPELSFLPPVPWTCDPCSINIVNVGFRFQKLCFKKDYDFELCLDIKGKGDQDTGEFWMALEFDHLIELKGLEIDSCPPLLLDRLKMLSSLKYFRITNVGTSGKELTRVLAYMPKLSDLSINRCQKITELGVIEQQEKTTPSMGTRFSDWMTRVGAWAGRLIPGSLDRQFTVTSNDAETYIGVHDSSREEDEITQAEDGLLLLPPQLQKLKIWYCPELSLRPDDSAGGLQGLRSLRYLQICDCPKFLLPSSASSSSSCCCPFPTSLQKLTLMKQSLTIQPTADCIQGRTVSLSNLASLTELDIDECEGGEGFWRHLPRGCITQLSVYNTRNFFLVDPQGLPSSQLQQDDDGLPPLFSVLQSLSTNDAAGLLAAPICSLLASSLTELVLYHDQRIERFSKEQEEALQLLTSLQELKLLSLKKLRCLPAGLRGLPRLRTLRITYCPAIRSLPAGGLPDSLHTLSIQGCKAIRSLPKGCLPNSLQELQIWNCKAIRTLPKDGLPSSLRRLDVRYCFNEELKRHCRKLIGTIPIVQVDRY